MSIRDRIIDFRRVPASSLRPNPKNWRVHPEEQKAALAGVLAEVGYVDAVMAREKDGGLELIDGHLRADTAGDDLVPVIVVDLDDAEAEKVLLTFDPLSSLAKVDGKNLDDLLSRVSTQSAGLQSLLDGLAKDAASLASFGVGDNVAPAPPDAATTRRGELIELGRHRLLCGDSSSPADLDRLLGGEPIHLVNTDPPYNVKVEPRSNNAIAAGLSSFQGTLSNQGADLARHPSKSKPTEKKLRARDRPLANDFVSDDEFDRFLAAWFGNIARVLLPGRGFYIWGGYANCANYPPVLKATGLYFSQAVIWEKGHPVLTRKDFMGNHEWCFYGWREGAAHCFFGPMNVPDTWRAGTVILSADLSADLKERGTVLVEVPAAIAAEIPSDLWHVRKVSPQSMVHLTEKPIELAARAIAYSSRRGENVLDLFGGSGSTLMACEKLERRAFLMELDPLYCDVIVKRWEEATGGKAVRST